MATPFKLDHEELSRCASELREAMLTFKHRNIPYFRQLIDQELEHLKPILDLCIAKKLDEPFPMIRYVNPRLFGDVLDFPELTNPYYRLAGLLRGRMTHEEFWASEYTKEPRLPKQYRKSPEWRPG